MVNTTMSSPSGAMEQEFQQLSVDKKNLLTRCEQYAGWTLPSLFTPTTSANSVEQQLDFQSLGAQGTNHLSNKLVFALFNPSRPFFKLETSEEFEEKLVNSGVGKAELQLVYSKVEKKSLTSLLKRRFRANIVMIMKLLVITGNGLFYIPPDGSNVQVYNLRDYCTKRDLSGKVSLIITKDHKRKGTLPENIQEQLPTFKDEDNVVLYTRIELKGKRYHMTQAVNNVMLESTGEWDEKSSPWIPLVWNLPRGWQYGTGLVEEYAGTFHAVSLLTDALVRAGVIAADIKFLVDPAGVTDFQALNRALSGEYVPGRPKDIEPIQLGKAQDLQTASSLLEKLERRIGQAFLLNSAVTRDAERVTSVEIRLQAQELETSLGGVYSTLADDFQTPLAYLALKDVDFAVDGEKIEPLIITGMDSLQRDNDADNMMLFLQDLSLLQNVPPQVLETLKTEPLAQLLAANRGVDYSTIIKTAAEVQKGRAAQQQIPQQGV
jgi:hypothetical protein